MTKRSPFDEGMKDFPHQPQRDALARSRTIARPNLQTRFTRFPVIYSIMSLTILVYVGQEISILLLRYDIVINLGAKINEAIYAGQWWRFVTPIFIHASLLHVFVNMYSLNAIGPTVEVFLNRPRTLVVYIFSGIAGVLFSLAFTPNPSVGASGSIFGLLGALGMFLFLNKGLLGAAGQSYLRRIVFIALLNLGLGLSPGIDNWGHLGGLVAGVAITWFIGPRLERNWIDDASPAKVIDVRPWAMVRSRVFIIATFVLLLAYIGMQGPF